MPEDGQEHPSKHKIAVLEDEGPPEAPPAEPPPSLASNLGRYLVRLVIGGGLFALVFGAGMCAGWFFFWRDVEPEVVRGGSIAVLPFVIQGEDEALGADFVDQFRAALDDEPLLDLLPRETTDPLGDDERGLQDIGEELGVRWMVQGELRPRADKVAVTVRLVDIEQGGLVFSETTTTAVDELATLDDVVTDKILVATRCREPGDEP